MRDTLRCLQSPAIVFVLLFMLSDEIYLRLKPSLVVKISSDIVTEHYCQVCILSMMFCRSGCRLCAGMCGKSLSNQEAFRSITLFDFTPTGQHEKYSLHLILTFFQNRDPSVIQLFHVVVFQLKRFPVLVHRNPLWNCWIMLERSKMKFISIHIMANQNSYHDDKSA